LRDHKEAVRRIVEKITGSVEIDRETALHALLILAGLRGLEEVVEEEARKVPILNDILDNKVLGREFKKGLQEGRQEGLQEGERKGERKGEREGERKLLRLIIERRFGPMPGWAEERLASRSTAEMEDLSVRVQDAPSIEDLLR
jgi:predicted transposase YdaD